MVADANHLGPADQGPMCFHTPLRSSPVKLESNRAIKVALEGLWSLLAVAVPYLSSRGAGLTGLHSNTGFPDPFNLPQCLSSATFLLVKHFTNCQGVRLEYKCHYLLVCTLCNVTLRKKQKTSLNY